MTDRTEPQPEARQLAQEAHAAIVLDCWPSPAATCDWGLDTPGHLGFLEHALTWGGATPADLDAVCGDGPAITALCRKHAPDSPYADRVFVTAYDMMEDIDEDIAEPHC